MRHLIIFVTFATALASKNERYSTDIVQSEDAKISHEDSVDDGNDRSLEEHLNEYIKKSDFAFKIPPIGSIALDARNLDNDQLNLRFDFGSSNSEVQARKKSKIKKIFIPILIFILLKALVLVPLALGILGIKTWNAIQLSFVSFVSALVLAIWKLCSKVNHDHPPAIIHNAWDPYHHDRSDISQQMAYSNYAPT